ncbi:hypothetical protein BDR07DRAFT_1343431 [Suillus spraguei]|nr:hypothetical protein BDR07DRAFT_1343431 [Suillus spraguei]
MNPEQNLPDLTHTPMEHFDTQLQAQQRQPSQSLVGFVDSGGRSQTQSLATEKPLPGNDSSEGHPPARDRNDPYADFEPILRAPPATRSRDGHMIRGLPRGTVGSSQAPDLGWIVPVNERPHRKTIKERLEPSIRDARREREQYARKAKIAGYTLNIAIALQVLLGALTTGLAAALSSSSGNKVGVATATLGGMSTLVASYLARMRGSNEPELSITRVKDLDQYLRDCLAFEMDHGHEYGTDKNGLNDRLEHLRKRFEELLGNADGQRKLSPPVNAANDKTNSSLK